MKMNLTPICNGGPHGHSSTGSRRDCVMPESNNIKGQETRSTNTARFLITISGCSEHTPEKPQARWSFRTIQAILRCANAALKLIEVHEELELFRYNHECTSNQKPDSKGIHLDKMPAVPNRCASPPANSRRLSSSSNSQSCRLAAF